MTYKPHPKQLEFMNRDVDIIWAGVHQGAIVIDKGVNRMNGIVKTVTAKGFGFVRADGTGMEYFFHRDDYLGQWNELEIDFSRKPIPVEFTEVPSGRGPRAANVRRID